MVNNMGKIEVDTQGIDVPKGDMDKEHERIINSLEDKNKLHTVFHVTEIGSCITSIQHRKNNSPRLPPFKCTIDGSTLHETARQCSAENVLKVLEEYDAKNYPDKKPKLNWLGCKQMVNDDQTLSYHSDMHDITISGTPDRVFHLHEGDIYVILDWKSGSRYQARHVNQLKRYSALLAHFLNRDIQCYLAIAYKPVFEFDAESCDVKLVSMDQLKTWEYFQPKPKDIYDVVQDTHWLNKAIGVFGFGYFHEPTMQFECTFCPYNAVCRGYPFGVPPVDEVSRFDTECKLKEKKPEETESS